MTTRLRTSRLAVLVAAPLLVLLTGCMDITGRGPAPLDTTLKGQIEAHPRVGHVYCMRGWLGIFSTGMDELARKIDTELGVSAVSVANEEHFRLQDFIVEKHKDGKINEPLVLLGHSWGADDQIRVAQTLKEHGITVDLLVVIDPVTPPDVPDNVKRVYCIYKSNPATDWYPFWRGVPVKAAKPELTPVTNIDLRTAPVSFDTRVHHVNIEKLAGVHQMAMDEISKVCVVRPGMSARVPAVAVPATPTAVIPTLATPAAHAVPKSPVAPAGGAAVTPN